VVTLLAEDDHDALIEAKDLFESDEAVVLGNFELEDHMRVAAQPASSQPASIPASEPSR
jgi:hypothetical protein